MSRRKRKAPGRRQSNPYRGPDRFTKKAKEEGYAARSVFKLSEVQRRFPLLRRGDRVVDLGCFPGSWTRYALEQVGPQGRVVGVDLQAPDDLPEAVFVERSALEVDGEELVSRLGGMADVLLSDMAPRTVGVALTDHVRQVELARRALALARDVVREGGGFLVKVFDGEEVPALQREIRQVFGRTRRIRPEAVRQNSREFFILATERRPFDRTSGRGHLNRSPEAERGEETSIRRRLLPSLRRFRSVTRWQARRTNFMVAGSRSW